jgi:hypothetical protein
MFHRGGAQVKPAFQQSAETLWGDVREACTFVYGWLFRHWNTRTGVKLGAVLPLLLARKQVSVTRSAPLEDPTTSLTHQLSMDIMQCRWGRRRQARASPAWCPCGGWGSQGEEGRFGPCPTDRPLTRVRSGGCGSC